MSRQEIPARRTAIVCVLFSLSASGTVFAQDDEDASAGAELAPATASESEAKAPEPSTDAVPSADDAERSAAVAAVGLERLSGAAFPAPQTRGIPGGSLAATMHGLQWPYLPALPGAPSTRIGFSGSAWVDSSYRTVQAGVAADPDLHEWRQQSRLVLRATPTYNASGGWFAQAQGEFVLLGATPANNQENLGSDDLYVRLGQWNVFDVSAGRFQGWEVYHLGMGLDLNTVERDGAATNNNRPVDLRDLQFLWDRADGPGNIALHLYPTEFLRFELLGRVGGTGLNELGVRPAGILDLGVVKAKIAAEYLQKHPREQSADRKDHTLSKGVLGSLQAVLDPVVELGGTFAYMYLDTYNAQGVLDAGQSSTTIGTGGFANVRVLDRLLFGAGANYVHQHNLKTDPTGKLNDVKTHLQVFGAAQYAIWDQFYIKGVVAYANALFNPESDPPPIAVFRNKSLSGRLRLMYAF
jgi:hypothetical protein